MNIILSCNLLKSSLILYLDLAATYQKLYEVHLYPNLFHTLENSVLPPTPQYLGTESYQNVLEFDLTENYIKLCVLFERDIEIGTY